MINEKGRRFLVLTVEVGRVGWPLMQMGWFKPKGGQLPQ